MHDVPADAGDASASARDGATCVMVVDDELIVRDLLRCFLVLEGYRVLVAADGIEALALFRRHPRTLRAVILDVAMPRMDGREALLAMRKIDPTIPVLVMSDCASGQTATDLIGQPGTRFIRKPFALRDVLARLEGLLESRARAPATWHMEPMSRSPRRDGVTAPRPSAAGPPPPRLPG